MKKSVVVSATSTIISLFLVGQIPSVFAADLEWSGTYRIEAYSIKNSELSDADRGKDYGLHHLIMRPKISASDGLTIYGRFDLLNSANSEYLNSQMGQVFGNGVGDASPSSANDSNALSDNQEFESLQISQLYLTYIQEFGALIVGRTPVQFGLGMSYSAGDGLFDHWLDTRDLVGYKFMLGNLYFLPMVAKVQEGSLHRNDDITEYLLQLQYENPETDLEMGLMYQIRKSNAGANDAPTGSTDGAGEVLGGNSSADKGLDLNNINLYVAKDTERFRVGVEAAFNNGQTGVVTSDGTTVKMSGFGVAAEFEYRPEDSLWKYGINAGTASGDDPSTDDAFEGFIFDRNYDVAFLLFNHPVGQDDFFRTALVGGGPTSGVVQTADTEAISNVFYFSPYAKYSWTDTLKVETALTAGWLSQNPLSHLDKDADKSVGYEWDIGLDYSPRKGVTWLTQIGLLFPGKAFEGDDLYDSSFAYGLTTKAAISF